MSLRSLFFSAFAAVALAACATTAPGVASFDRASISDQSRLAQFDAVFIAPVEVGPELAKRMEVSGRPLSRRADDRPIAARDVQMKSNDLRQELTAAISPLKRVVNAPGDNVLTITPVLTKLQPNKPTFGDLSNDPSLSFRSVYAGGAAAEFRFSENGRSLGSVRDSYSGRIDENFPNQPTWSDVDRTFARWARNIAAMVT